MSRLDIERERLSIDVSCDEHRQIKAYAALHSETIREYVLRCVRERIRKDAEEKSLQALHVPLSQDPILKNIWDNKKDAAYDKL